MQVLIIDIKIGLNNLSTKEHQNLLKEASFLAAVHSLFVVSYYDSFFTNTHLCIIMEFAEGGDLNQYIQKKFKVNHSNKNNQKQDNICYQNNNLHYEISRVKNNQHNNKRKQYNNKEILLNNNINKINIKENQIMQNNDILAEEEFWKIAKDIFLGVQCLHQHNIIHRDLKPANIFKSKGHWKIGDLGVATQKRLARTQTGTPFYASPEIWAGTEYDQKADVWSVGCILYELCMGFTPFAKDFLDLCSKNHIQKKIPAQQKYKLPPIQPIDIETLYKRVKRGVYAPIQIYSQKVKAIISDCIIVQQKQRYNVKQIVNKYWPAHKKNNIECNSFINDKHLYYYNPIKIIPQNQKNVFQCVKTNSQFIKQNNQIYLKHFNNLKKKNRKQKAQKIYQMNSQLYCNTDENIKQQIKNNINQKLNRAMKKYRPEIYQINQESKEKNCNTIQQSIKIIKNNQKQQFQQQILIKEKNAKKQYFQVKEKIQQNLIKIKHQQKNKFKSYLEENSSMCTPLKINNNVVVKRILSANNKQINTIKEKKRIIFQNLSQKQNFRPIKKYLLFKKQLKQNILIKNKKSQSAYIPSKMIKDNQKNKNIIKQTNKLQEIQKINKNNIFKMITKNNVLQNENIYFRIKNTNEIDKTKLQKKMLESINKKDKQDKYIFYNKIKREDRHIRQQEIQLLKEIKQRPYSAHPIMQLTKRIQIKRNIMQNILRQRRLQKQKKIY